MSEANIPTCIHLAVITETWPPEVNGVAHTIHHLVQGLRKLDRYQLELVRPRQFAAEQAQVQEGFTEYLTKGVTLPFYKEVNIGLPQYWTLKKRWTQHRPDIVQIVTEGPLGYSAMRAAKSLGIPVFSDFHTNFDQYSRHYHLKYAFRFAGAYLRHLHNQTLCTLVPTHELLHQLLEAGYRSLGILERGIDAELFHPEKRSNALRQSLGVSDEQLLVVLVSRMAQEKNLDLAFSSFRQIQKAVPNARFLLVGDGPERERLEAEYPDCLFVGMQVGQALAEHYASGDLFLYPSTSETFGNVIIEAMASGLPVLTYDYAAAHKYIQSGHNGVTVPFDDEAAFHEAAIALAQDTAQARQLIGNMARETAQELSWESVVNRLDNIINDLLTEVYHEASTPT